MQKFWAVPLILGVAACSPAAESTSSVPTGVGFGSYNAYQRQQAELEQQRQASVVPGPRISDESQAMSTVAAAIANDEAPRPTAPAAVPSATPAAAPSNSQSDPMPAAPQAPVNAAAVANVPEASPIWDTPVDRPVPEPAPGSDAVADENSFSRVTAQRTRHEDAARLERNRERYVIIEPTELPKRPGSNKPNIVAYAVATTNPLGEPLYRRSASDNAAASARSCAKFFSADLAQEAFLSAGGPKRDPKNLDPDGDGFACKWDPTVFRSVKK